MHATRISAAVNLNLAGGRVMRGVRFLSAGDTRMDEKRIAALQFLTNRYIDNVWKHVGIHLLAAGWVLSSAQLQLLLIKSIWVKVGLTVIFAILQWVHWVINRPIYNHIKELVIEIEDEQLAEFYGVGPKRFFWNEVMIGSIALFAVAFVWGSPYL